MQPHFIKAIVLIILYFNIAVSYSISLPINEYDRYSNRSFAVDRKNDIPILIYGVKPGRKYSIFIQKNIEFAAEPKKICSDFSEKNLKIKKLSAKVIMIHSIKIDEKNDSYFMMFNLKNYSDAQAEYEITVASNARDLQKEQYEQELQKRYEQDNSRIELRRRRIFESIKSMNNKELSFISYNADTGEIKLGADFVRLYEALFLSEFYIDKSTKSK